MKKTLTVLIAFAIVLNMPIAEASKRSERLKRRAERIEERQAKRAEKRKERKEHRQEKRAERKENRKERQAKRHERRDDRKTKRLVRRLERHGQSEMAQNVLAAQARAKAQQGNCDYGFIQTSNGCVVRGTPRSFAQAIQASSQASNPQSECRATGKNSQMCCAVGEHIVGSPGNYSCANAIAAVDTGVSATCADGYKMSAAGNCEADEPTPIIRKPAGAGSAAL